MFRMNRNKIQTTLKVKWSKEENCFEFLYPCREAKFLGYEIAKFMQELINKNEYKDLDLKTFKCSIEITKDKYEKLIKEPPLRD